MNTAKTILEQLGGNKFIVMTGAKNFLYADVTESNPVFWLRMDLPKNAGKVNRLKVYLNADDTYTMEFYSQRMTKEFDVKISNSQKFEGVYSDMLQSIFTKVTGMYTSLGTMNYKKAVA